MSTQLVRRPYYRLRPVIQVCLLWPLLLMSGCQKKVAVPVSDDAPAVLDADDDDAIGGKKSVALQRGTDLTDVDVPPAETRLQPIVLVEVTSLEDPTKGAIPSHLEQELARQALLMTARDTLGLSTRDAALGEALPTGVAQNNVLRTRLSPTRNAKTLFTVQSAAGKSQKPLWGKEGKMAHDPPTGLLGTLVWIDALRRADLSAALTRAGFEDKRAVPQGSAAFVDAATEALLDDMTFFAQFRAVQALHAEMRTKGKSPWLIGALARAYAHLGMLTECQWSHAHAAYKARALLYAQQLCGDEPRSPWGVWHRAYALALTGQHKLALEDVALAQRLLDRQVKKGSDPPPSWVGLIEAFCRFDCERLQKAVQEGKQPGLTRLLHFLAAESRTSVLFTMAAARTVLEHNPECLRVHDSIAEVGGVSNRHVTTVAGMELFTGTFPERVGALPGLPDAVAMVVKAKRPEQDIIRALAEAGRSADVRAVPSWSALAHWAREARFLQVCQRLDFMRDSWAVPVDEFLEEARPLIAEHPYASFLETYRFQLGQGRSEIARLLSRLPVEQLDSRALILFRVFSQVDLERYRPIVLMVVGRTPVGYLDSVMKMRFFTGGDHADDILMFLSPHAPVARAAAIRYLWHKWQHNVGDWLREPEARHPDVLRELGRHYAEVKQTDQAEDYLKRALALSADLDGYRILAGVYKEAGKTDQWLATLESFLQAEDTGLDHAKVRVELARYYMAQKDFRRAEPFAAAAAETWAQWAMDCAVQCYEGLGEWDKAELWARRIAERYQPAVWFQWCLRTGKGDLQDALRMLKQHLDRPGGARNLEDLVLLGICQYLTRELPAATETFREVNRQVKRTSLQLFLATIHDQNGGRAERDALLKDVSADEPLAPLAAVFRDNLAKGEKAELDRQRADAVVKAMPADRRATGYFLLACFLEPRGPADVATDYFRRSLAEVEGRAMLIDLIATARLHPGYERQK